MASGFQRKGHHGNAIGSITYALPNCLAINVGSVAVAFCFSASPKRCGKWSGEGTRDWSRSTCGLAVDARKNGIPLSRAR